MKDGQKEVGMNPVCIVSHNTLLRDLYIYSLHLTKKVIKYIDSSLACTYRLQNIIHSNGAAGLITVLCHVTWPHNLYTVYAMSKMSTYVAYTMSTALDFLSRKKSRTTIPFASFVLLLFERFSRIPISVWKLGRNFMISSRNEAISWSIMLFSLKRFRQRLSITTKRLSVVPLTKESDCCE